MVEGPYEGVPIAILSSCHWSLGFDDGVNTAHWGRVSNCSRSCRNKSSSTSMGYLSSNLKEEVVLDIAGWLLLAVGGHGREIGRQRLGG